MARVPVPAVGNITQLRAAPAARFSNVDVGGGLQDVGQSLQRAGEDINRVAQDRLEIQEMEDRARVKEADNAAAKRLQERLWTADDAFFNREGLDAKDAAPQLETEFGAIKQELLEGLTSERQRRYFSQAFDQRVLSEQQGVARHVRTQVRAEEKRQSLARIGSSADEALRYWDDQEKRDGAIGTALIEIRTQAAEGGWAPETLDRAEDELVSNIHQRRITGLLDTDNVDGAVAQLELSRSSLLPEAIQAIEGALAAPLRGRQADSIVDMLLGTLPPDEVVDAAAVAPGRGEVLPRMLAITRMSESGDRETDARGRRITSPVGARGIMQVMPATARNPGYGLRPSNGTPADDRRLGEEYFAKMLQINGGDARKAWAAYNWGQGNLEKAVARHGASWLQHAPAETRAYVTKNMAALGGGTGSGEGATPPQSSPREHDLAALTARIDELNLPYELEQEVRRQLTGRVAFDEQLLQRDRAKAEQDAWAVVEAKGDSFTSINQLPASVRNRLTPSQRMSFDGVAERNLAALQAEAKETDWGAYSRYSDLYATNPAAFARVAPSELRANLDDTEFKQVMDWRADVLGGKQGKSTKQLTHERVRSVTNPMLLAAGIFTPSTSGMSPSMSNKTKGAHYARVGKFQTAVLEDLETWRANNPGKVPDDNVIKSIADVQLLKVYRGTGEDREAAGYQFENRNARGLTFDMPKADLVRIQQAYRERWGRLPTNQEAAEIYRFGPRGGR